MSGQKRRTANHGFMKVEQAEKLSKIVRQASEIVKDSIDGLTKLAENSLFILVNEENVNPKILSSAKSENRLLNKSELAERLNVSISTISNMQNEGLPSVKLLTSVRFEYAEVLEWLKVRDKKPYRKNNLRVVR